MSASSNDPRPLAPVIRFGHLAERQSMRWGPLRDVLGAEAGRTFDAVLQRAKRLVEAAPDAPVPNEGATLLLAVLADLEAEIQRLLARVAWLEQESDYQNAIRRAMAHPNPRYAQDDEPEPAQARA